MGFWLGLRVMVVYFGSLAVVGKVGVNLITGIRGWEIRFGGVEGWHVLNKQIYFTIVHS